MRSRREKRGGGKVGGCKEEERGGLRYLAKFTSGIDREEGEIGER